MHFISVSAAFLSMLLLFSCSEKPKSNKLVEFKGKTMGSGYSLSYHDSLQRNFQAEIDSLLAVFDQEISTYRDDSRLMAFNKSDSGIFIPKAEANHLVRNFKLAKKIHQLSSGWFNPALMPLVNYWGFGKGEKKGVENPDTNLVRSLLGVCDFTTVSLEASENGTFIRKLNPKTQIVFNAIAPGDAADEIGKFLENKGISHYLVEVGGEIRCRGNQSKDYGWIIGINTPIEGAAINDMQVIVELKNLSLATSGNYRSFIEINGRKYAHTINPKTGFPEKNELLSASIFTKDCGDADAIATSCMAMGLQKAWELVNSLPEVEAYFIYADEKGEMQVRQTDKVKEWIK